MGLAKKRYAAFCNGPDLPIRRCDGFQVLMALLKHRTPGYALPLAGV
jgi:hypothetical protein